MCLFQWVAFTATMAFVSANMSKIAEQPIRIASFNIRSFGRAKYDNTIVKNRIIEVRVFSFYLI